MFSDLSSMTRTIASATLILLSIFSSAQKPGIGIAQGLEHDSLLYVAGYRHIVESINKLISPRNVSEEQFTQNVATLRKLKTKVYAVNLFIPGDLKLVGPQVNEQTILTYVEQVLLRCKQAEIKMVVWGSGGARRIPDGFDLEKAKEQFAFIAQKIAVIAKKHNVMLALENLNSTETNFITTAAEALAMVKRVNHPNFRLCVDIYHMLKENETPEVIEAAGRYVVHCDIAEKENRTPPGVMGEDFRPYLKALKKIKYNGKIVIEGRWENVATQASPAYQYLQQQIDEVYGK
jgi:sugar phosphate isomerase/epimerase